jgi:hypothetical protein
LSSFERNLGLVFHVEFTLQLRAQACCSIVSAQRVLTEAVFPNSTTVKAMKGLVG